MIIQQVAKDAFYFQNCRKLDLRQFKRKQKAFTTGRYGSFTELAD